MAKKKTKDTKGLAGIVNKVPREIDINGQLHMLAWITPKEGRTLKDLGGAGVLGPMGIPTYFTDDDEAGAGDFGMGPDDPGGHAGDTDTSDAETDDPDTAGAGSTEKGAEPGGGDRVGTAGPGVGGGNDGRDDYKGSVGTGFGSYKGGAYEGDTGRVGQNYSNKSYAFDGFGRDRLYGGSTKAQRQEIATREGVVADRIRKEIEAGNVYDYVIDPETGLIGGVTHKQTGVLGSIGNALTSMMGLEGLVLGDRVYTGRSDLDPFDTGGGRDGGDDRGLEKKVVVTATDAKVSAVPTSPPSYYGQGVGTATTNLYDPTKIDPYIASLYGITPSPIGATYDAATSSYSMPGSKKDAKSRTRLRGLDIFKPVSTVS